ncbi:unnamed protein product [Dovyalis caffra]|uniref:Uncharacterized protein n=1 Tax=Dovyalis caffra TaxID=77055 RepID=A0AAV1RDP0_9ROSI|nr:unnamed protein product [Dovyalis caffra]
METTGAYGIRWHGISGQIERKELQWILGGAGGDGYVDNGRIQTKERMDIIGEK